MHSNPRSLHPKRRGKNGGKTKHSHSADKLRSSGNGHNSHAVGQSTKTAQSPGTFETMEECSLPMGIIGLNGKIRYMNAAARRLAELSLEEMPQRDFLSFFAIPEETGGLFEQALKFGATATCTVAWPSPTGKKLELEFCFNRFQHADGSMGGVFFVFRDLSKERALQHRMLSTSQYSRNLLEASLDPLLTISPDGKIMDVNRATELATGYNRETLIGSDFSDYFTDPQKAREGYQKVFSEGQVSDYPLVLRHTTGAETEVLYNASIYRDDEGRVAGVFAAARDVTQLKRSQQELETTNHEVTLLSEMNNLLQSCSTESEAFPVITTTLEKLFPKTCGRILILKTTATMLLETSAWGNNTWKSSTISPSDCWALRRGRMHDIGLEESLNPPCRALAEKNTYLCIPLQAHGRALGIVHIVFDGIESPPHDLQRIRQLANAAADNISLALANLRLRESLQSLSIRDPLTGLYNRRFMEEEVDRSISRMTRLQKPMALAFLDIDHFKDYNDKFGHDAGDAVMKAIAELMESFRQGSDVACRYGGEEFVVVMPETGPDQAKRKIESFRKSVRQLSLRLNGQTLPGVDISVGLSFFPEHGRTTAELLKQADNALYRAKQQGRNCIEVAGREFLTPDQPSVGNTNSGSTNSRVPVIRRQETSSGQQPATRPHETQTT